MNYNSLKDKATIEKKMKNKNFKKQKCNFSSVVNMYLSKNNFQKVILWFLMSDGKFKFEFTEMIEVVKCLQWEKK